MNVLPHIQFDLSCLKCFTVSIDKLRIALILCTEFIIGKAGNTKHKIQNETGSTIQIPNIKSPSEEIGIVLNRTNSAVCLQYTVITGQSEGSVSSAKNRIDLIVESVCFLFYFIFRISHCAF